MCQKSRSIFPSFVESQGWKSIRGPHPRGGAPESHAKPRMVGRSALPCVYQRTTDLFRKQHACIACFAVPNWALNKCLGAPTTKFPVAQWICRSLKKHQGPGPKSRKASSRLFHPSRNECLERTCAFLKQPCSSHFETWIPGDQVEQWQKDLLLFQDRVLMKHVGLLWWFFSSILHQWEKVRNGAWKTYTVFTSMCFFLIFYVFIHSHGCWVQMMQCM